MKKRILVLFISTLLIISLLPTAVLAGGQNYIITNAAPQSDSANNHGYISIDKEDAGLGATVTITVNPEEGYELKSLTCTPNSTISTIADVLATVDGFPESASTGRDAAAPPDAWSNGNGGYTYINSSNIGFLKAGVRSVYVGTSTTVTKGENCYTASTNYGTLKFNMKDGALASIEFSSNTDSNKIFDGTYTSTSISPAVPEPIIPEKQTDGTYQFTMPSANVTVKAEFEEAKADITDATISASETPVYSGEAIPAEAFGIEVYLDNELLPTDGYTINFYNDVSCASGYEVADITDAGVYYAVAVGLEAEGYTGTCGPVKVKVIKASLAKPAKVSGTIIYDATEKTGVIVPLGADPNKYIISGDKATEVGVYLANIALADPFNYCWASESGDPEDSAISKPFTIEWKIDPAAKITYIVNFVMNGHGTQIDKQEVEEGCTAAKPADPTAEGWTFDGWYVDEKFIEEFDFNSVIIADTSIYAKWTENAIPQPPVYTVIHGANSEWTNGAAEGLLITSDAPFAKFECVKVDGSTIPETNYTAVEGSTKITLVPSYLKTLSPGKHSIEIVSTDGSVSTNFTVKEAAKPPVPGSYTVTFNMGGHGTQVTAQTVESGSKAAKPADPTAEGWTFDGWYADKTFKAKFDFNTAITADTTLYAKWTEKSAGPANPPTGDNSHMSLWIALLLVSGVAFAGTSVYRKKRNSAE